MSTFATDPKQTRKLSREEALKLASDRKAARRRRTSRIRKSVAVLAVSAFIGPFAVIYGNVAAGKDPALSATSSAKAARATTTGSTASGGSRTSSDSGTSTSTSSSPAAVTTQQS